MGLERCRHINHSAEVRSGYRSGLNQFERGIFLRVCRSYISCLTPNAHSHLAQRQPFVLLFYLCSIISSYQVLKEGTAPLCILSMYDPFRKAAYIAKFVRKLAAPFHYITAVRSSNTCLKWLKSKFSWPLTRLSIRLRYTAEKVQAIFESATTDKKM